MTRPDGFAYRAGQFVQFTVPTEGGDVLRSYSISSHPGEDTLEFCIKLIPGGRASSFFSGVTPDTDIRFSGPAGRFVCDAIGTPQTFIATGAGMAPIWGMIADELQNKNNTQPVRLIFGVRADDDVFWADRLAALAAAHPNFSYLLTLSRPSTGWTGASGRVTAHTETLPDTGHFYLCGNADMVKDMRAALLAKSIPPAQIHFEIF
jgi:ferredoxin-NADP reductase